MNYRGTLRQRIQHSHNIKTGTIKVWFNVHDTEEMGQKENSLPHVILRKILTWHVREPVQVNTLNDDEMDRIIILTYT